MSKRQRGFAPFLLTALLLATSACATQTTLEATNAPAKVLFVGNSFTYYNNSLHNHYLALMKAAAVETDKPLRVRSKTISGGRLPEHEAGLQYIVASENWDVVVMQGHSLGPISESTAGAFEKAAERYAGFIRETGAQPVFFMTWAYTGKPAMTAELDRAYSSIGASLDADVVPVGLAFARVTESRPDIALRIADARHPTLEGTYLAACTFFATLTGSSPEGNSYTATLDSDVANYLQRVAWETVTEYRRR